jgi:hypothetical protein
VVVGCAAKFTFRPLLNYGQALKPPAIGDPTLTSLDFSAWWRKVH